jgi:glycine reductase
MEYIVRLELNILDIKDVQFGDVTEIKDKVLHINDRELQSILEKDKTFSRVDIELAHPGESCRILQVADVIEPRCKVAGEVDDFPGALGKSGTVGEGKTCVLRGTAVLLNDQISAEIVTEAEDPMGYIIDMAGPGAEAGLYGKTQNVVVIPYPAEGIHLDSYRIAMKKAGLKTAAYLAQSGKDLDPDSVEVYDLPPLPGVDRGMEDLPKIGYIFMVYCTSFPAIEGEPILYGDNIRRFLPTIIHPNEVLDGAIVNPYEGIGTETYVIQNHPVIKALYQKHGKELCFVGVILTVSRYTEPERERAAAMAANQARSILGADGVILTKASSGAPDIDMAQTAQRCEDQGVKSVLIMFDRSNRGELGTVFNLPGASSIVATANHFGKLQLPAVKRVIGKSVTLPSGVHSEDGFEKIIRYIRGGLDQEGISKIMPVRY